MRTIKNVLELASGDKFKGFFYHKEILSPDSKYIAVDWSKGAQKTAVKIARQDSRFEFRLENITDLPLDFPDKTFDIVHFHMFTNITEFGDTLIEENYPRILRETARLLKKDGEIYTFFQCP